MNVVKPLAVEATYPIYLRGLLAGDRPECRAVFEQWLDADLPLREIYVNLVQRSMYEVGELWARGEVSVATEHLATVITESLMNLLYPRLFAGPRRGKTAVVACVPNELHQTGAKIVADYFELHGWRSFFLGANTPVDALRSMIAEKRPHAAVLCATMGSHLESLLETVAAIRAAFPDLAILAGGQALGGNGRERVERIPGVRALRSLAELETWIEGGAGDV